MSELWQDNELRIKIAGILSGVVTVTLPTFFIVVQTWANTAPSKPNEALGNVFAHNDHGSITYFTGFQATSAAMLFWISFAGIGLTILTMPKHEIKTRRFAGVPLAASWKGNYDKRVARSWAIKGALVAAPAIWILGPLLVGWLNQAGIVLNV